MNRIVHFEIPCDDMMRAKDFYEKVFGWQFAGMGPEMDYLTITTGTDDPGINGGMYKRTEPVSEGSENAYSCVIQVADIDEYVKKINENGGTLIAGKKEIPHVGWVCRCKDTEQNLFTILQPSE